MISSSRGRTYHSFSPQEKLPSNSPAFLGLIFVRHQNVFRVAQNFFNQYNIYLSSGANRNIFIALAMQYVALQAREKKRKLPHVVSVRTLLLATWKNVAATLQQNQLVLIFLHCCSNKNMFPQQISEWFQRGPWSATHILQKNGIWW